MTLAPCLEFLHAATIPQETAITWGGRSISWMALNNYVHSTSRYLKEIAIRNDDRIILVDDGSAAYPIVILALWRIGARVCLLKADCSFEDIVRLNHVLKPQGVIACRSLLQQPWDKAVRYADIQHVVAYGYNDSFLGSDAALDPKIDLEDEAVLIPIISKESVAMQALTHQAWRADPKDLASLWHALSTGEPLVIS